MFSNAELHTFSNLALITAAGCLLVISYKPQGKATAYRVAYYAACAAWFAALWFGATAFATMGEVDAVITTIDANGDAWADVPAYWEGWAAMDDCRNYLARYPAGPHQKAECRVVK